jgi:ferredoxin-NADP reductase
VDEVALGDKFELRGPIGGFFVWAPGQASEKLLLIGAGSGVVPLMAMIRHRHLTGSRVPTRLLYSSRSLEDVIYHLELEQLGAAGDGFGVWHTLTRMQPSGWTGFARRVDRPMLDEVAWPAEESAAVYICGPTSFVEVTAGILVDLGYSPQTIRTEHFGPTGG